MKKNRTSKSNSSINSTSHRKKTSLEPQKTEEAFHAHEKQTKAFLHQSQEQIGDILNSTLDAIITMDENQKIIIFNHAAEEMFGCPVNEAIGRTLDRFLPDPVRKKHKEYVRAFGLSNSTKRSMVSPTLELTCLRASGEPFPSEVSISQIDSNGRKLYTAVVRDITERKKAEKQIVQMKRLYATLSQVNQTIVRVKDRDELYGLICDVAVKFGEFALAWVGLLDEETGDIRPVAANGLDITNWTFPGINIHKGGLKNGLIAVAIRTSKVATSEDIQTDGRLQSLYSQFGKHGYHSSAVIPFRLKGRTIGIVSLVSPQMGLFQAKEEVRLLEEMGLDISFALDTMEAEAVHKRAEEKIKDLSRFPEENPYPVLRVNSNGEIIYTNSASNLLLDEWGCKTGSELPPEWKDLVIKLFENNSRKMVEVNCKEITYSISFVPVHDRGYVNLYGVDVTERKQAEEEIQHQLDRLSSLREIDTAINSSFDIHVTLDIVLQQVIARLNVHACAVLLSDPHTQRMEYASGRGFRSNAIQNTHLKLGEGFAGRAILERQTIHIPDLKAAGGVLADALRSKNEDFTEYYGIPLIVKGEIKGVLEIYQRTPLKPDDNWLDFMEVLAGQAAIAIDNAQLFERLQRANAELEQRVAERTAELNQLNIELQHASRAKDEFLAAMSHELRTPLNSILGLSESLLEQRRDPLSERQQQSLQIIGASGHHLLELINDVLDLSKIEAGKFDFYPQIVDVDVLCQSSLSFVKEQAMRKSITLTHQGDERVSSIHADPRRLKQILVNLLSNAVKFTPDKGHITLQVYADADEDIVRFSIIDNGIGIAPEDLKRLFLPFSQVNSSFTRQFEGTGLGLAVVQKLIDLHGGSVEVESEVGVGSRFTVSLPWGRNLIAQQEGAASEHRPLADKQFEASSAHETILLAEDNMANILTVGEYLKDHGYGVVTAHDGLEAIEKAEEINPDIILMDIQMPAMDGLEATRRLKRNPRFASTPVIALTALTMPGDRERCLAAGANEYMSKPVSLKKLIMTIRALSTQKK